MIFLEVVLGKVYKSLAGNFIQKEVQMNAAIVFSLAMGLFHYFSEEFCLQCSKYKNHILSFSAGVSVTYIFLYLFPEFVNNVVADRLLPISILVGFALFHITEKYIYQKSPKKKWRQRFAVEDSIISFVYHFILGILIVVFLNQGIIRGTLFYAPVLIYTAISTLPVDAPKSKFVAGLLAASTLLGTLFALYVYPGIPQIVISSLLGFLIGVLSFTVFRHSIPEGKEGSPLFFILGILLYLSFLFIL